MKQKKRLYFLILLALGCLALLIFGTYAAYTNTAYVKRVVTTGTGTNAVPFSSNYLYEYNGGTYTNHIITVPNSDSGTQVHLAIYNYPPMDSTRFSNSSISYTLTIQVVDKAGNVKEDMTVPTISSNEEKYTLQGGQISSNVFVISFTHDQVDTFKDHRVRITAKTTEGLAPPVTLAAEFELISASATDDSWKGRFTDTQDAEYLDAFNYEVYGTAEGRITVSWENDYVALSKWSREDLAQSSTDNSISFNVGGDGKPTSYLMQFYRLRGRTSEDKEPEIKVTFDRKST